MVARPIGYVVARFHHRAAHQLDAPGEADQMMISTLVALSSLFVAFLIRAFEPRLTARSIRLTLPPVGDYPGSRQSADRVFPRASRPGH